MTNKTRLLPFLIALSSSFLFPLTLCAQRTAAGEQYIKTYNGIAMQEMRRYKIPASITLAQGLLESGAGQQTLARMGNNHFGIKCAGWTGKKVYKDDDLKNECFRSYSSAEESFEDHAKFLQRDRYASLFRLEITDYKGWAHGLKACGYATDPSYASKLIRIIESYELTQYDRQVVRGKSSSQVAHSIFRLGKLLYVVATSSDTQASLAKEFGIKKRHLRKYNEWSRDYTVRAGDIVYLQAKNSRAQKGHKTHTVCAGESLHSIAQKYGITTRSLRRRNHLDDNYRPVVGEELRLR
jgi:hypothetical protein